MNAVEETFLHPSFSNLLPSFALLVGVAFLIGLAAGSSLPLCKRNTAHGGIFSGFYKAYGARAKGR
jgi:hypothetical protein